MGITSSTNANVSIGKFRLWAAKPPLPGESCASWIQRLCGDHQYSFPVLRRVLGQEPQRADWDRPLDPSVLLRLAELVDLPELMQSFSELSLLGMLSRTLDSLGCLRVIDKKPAYKWCPTCFAEDETPHLRWYWRLEGIRECWVHQSPLNEQCLMCGLPIFVHRARLTGRSASLLSECAECGMFLSVPATRYRHYSRESQRKLRSIFAPWWLGSRQLNIEDANQLAVKYYAVITDHQRLAIARYHSNVRRQQELLRQENLWVFDSSCFQEGAALKVAKKEKCKIPWQWRLNPVQRLAVAEALWTIRGELRANRT